MVDPELQDLLPLYLTESQRRLEQLTELTSRIGEAEAVAEARRELHTLKGSSRMLKLRHVAELCHRGEALLEAGAAGPAQLMAVLDDITEALEKLARSASQAAEEDSLQPSGDRVAEARPRDRRAKDAPEAEAEFLTEHRISVEAADRLTGATAAMRLLALAGLASGRRLEELADLAESGVTEAVPRQVLAMLASQLRKLVRELEASHHRQLQHAEDQLKRLLDLQLQPLRPFLQSLARHARKLARDLGKEIEVELEGGEARLDQRIARELQGAFLHLVANAVDHGIESPEQRLELGKPRAGRLRVAATSFGDRVEIAVVDDGAGVDPARVLEAARDAGLLSPEVTELGGAEVLQLLFTTGFSTRREVSEVSGRGVGLDAVASAVRQLGGDVWMTSEPGRGSSIFVAVPAARRGERALVLRCGDERVAMPKGAVRWIRAARAGEVVTGSGGPLVAGDGGELLRVVSLAAVLGVEEPPEPVLVALQVGGTQSVLAVEAVEGEEEVLVRPLAALAGVHQLYSGIALLTSGEPVGVVSPQAFASHLQLAPPPRAAPAPPERLRVLLVEDSLVTREMERRMLEEEGFQVTATAAADDALRRLAEETYDCLVTDLEMPGMDGFELTRHVRSTPRLAQLPIVVVSTRDEPGDRLAGLEAGADAYVTKQTLEARKLAQILRRVGSRG